MSRYSTPLRAIIEKYSQDILGLSHQERIEIGRKHLFDFSYPIFDEDYRPVFETNFIRRFYFREIGFETEGAFKFHLETWLNIHMPYWNKIYESTLIEFDPLTNSRMEVKRNITKDTDQKQQSQTDGTSLSTMNQSNQSEQGDENFRRDLHSDNPDTRLRLTTEDGKGVIEYASAIDEDYEKKQRSASSRQESDSEDQTHVKGQAEVNIVEHEKYIQERVGKIGVQTYSKMIMEYRESLILVDDMIFNEMNNLFMLLY